MNKERIIKELQRRYRLHVPIGEVQNGRPVFWNGIPGEFSNFKKYNIGVSQWFGGNGEWYQKKGINIIGHNGIDIQFRKGTPILAPCDIEVQAVVYHDDGYGIHLKAFTKPVKIDGQEYRLGLVFGHLEKIVIQPFREYRQGTLLGYGDNTGLSTGHHLHFGVRPLYKKGPGWYQLLAGNGYYGYIDPLPFIIEKIKWTVGELEELKIKEKFMDKIQKLMQEKDGELFVNTDTGETAWLYDGKLRIPPPNRPERVALMVIFWAARKFGASIPDDIWKQMPKDVF